MPHLTIGEILKKSGLDRLESQIILAHVLGVDRVWLFVHDDVLICEEQKLEFDTLVQRRLEGEPIAYLVGSREFMGLELNVDNSVLIPRPDTELLVECALDFLKTTPTGARILDLGTGSGAIAISIANFMPKCEVYAVDISKEALKVAYLNAKNHGVHINFFEGSWFDALPYDVGTFDLIVSNPPYIASDDIHLQLGDVRYEPITALVGGNDGLSEYIKIMKQVHDFIHSGSAIMFEHGWTQGAELRRILEQGHCHKINTHKDLAGHERVTCGVFA